MLLIGIIVLILVSAPTWACLMTILMLLGVSWLWTGILMLITDAPLWGYFVLAGLWLLVRAVRSHGE
jgi:hypothetical protein